MGSRYRGRRVGATTSVAVLLAACGGNAVVPDAWTIETGAKTSEPASLAGISCPSSSDCWAVGSNSQPLIEHYNGSSWSSVSSPAPGGGGFAGISCVSTRECWAVGDQGNVQGSAVIARYDGRSWRLTPSPNASGSTLYAVACWSSSECWAVGQYTQRGVAIVDRFDGTAWTEDWTGPAPEPYRSELFGVACTEASRCWAVGNDGTAFSKTLVLGFDGQRWTRVSSPDSSPGYQLFGLACVPHGSCWAVGKVLAQAFGAFETTLVLQYESGRWQRVASQNSAPDESDWFMAVTCADSTDCLSVGFRCKCSAYFGALFRTLVERYDGSAWRTVTSPNAGMNERNSLRGVACVSARDCRAVGFHGGEDVRPYPFGQTPFPVSSQPSPLILHYAA